MERAVYESTWDTLNDERRRLTDQRTELETELSEITRQLAHIEEILSHLAPLAGLHYVAEFSALGMTDAIRLVLREATERMSTSEVRTALAEKGFDFSGHTAPGSSIHKILTRLDKSGEVEKETEDFRVYFTWKKTDDDIPF
jgi:hypothetical protein